MNTVMVPLRRFIAYWGVFLWMKISETRNYYITMPALMGKT